MDEEPVRKGRIVIGHIVDIDGVRIYFARRRLKHIFRARMPTISNAIADDVAGWALDEITLFNIRARKIELIGVRESDTGAVYLTKLAYFFDMSKGKIHDYQGIGGGSRQRCLSLSFFAQRKGSVRVRKGVLEGNQDKSLLSNAYQELIEEIPA